MKFIPLLFLFVFIVFACLQLNDPDPVRWTLAYLYAAFLSLLAYRSKLKRNLTVISALAFLAAAIFQWPPSYEGITGDMDGQPNIELARESLGLLICTIATVINFVISEKTKNLQN